VQCSAVKCSAVQCSAVQHDSICAILVLPDCHLHIAARGGECSAVQCSAVQCSVKIFAHRSAGQEKSFKIPLKLKTTDQVK
jgi:hypothetical protein